MHKKQNGWPMVLRLGIIMVLVFGGLVLYFTFPEQQANISGFGFLIFFGYFAALAPPNRELVELVILLAVIAIAVYMSIFPESPNGFLTFIPLAYLFYGFGKAFMFKELRNAFRYFKRRWKV